jgi:pimeloyl-ACP methyl ester carboxylesterase
VPKIIAVDRSLARHGLNRRTFALGVIALLCVPHRPVAAAEPVVTAEAITFSSGGTVLSGTLVRATRPVAAVVLVHGSGQEPRMADFATLLAKQGITTLTYDKRGVGESGGVYVGPEVGSNNVDPANLRQLADDANAAVRTLARKLPANRIPIGLVGFSQAGWIIPIAAQREASVRFMVMFSGPLVTTREQLRFQFLTAGDPGFWDTHRDADVRERVRTDPDRYDFVDTDPRDVLATLSIPGLWLFGGRDVQLPAALSIERLEALAARGKPFEHRLYPALGHNTAFAESSEPVTAAVQWIRAQSRARPGTVGRRHAERP